MMISDGEDLLAEAVADVREDVAARIDSLLPTARTPPPKFSNWSISASTTWWWLWEIAV